MCNSQKKKHSPWDERLSVLSILGYISHLQYLFNEPSF